MSCTEENQGEADSQDLFVQYGHTRDRVLREQLILRHLPLVAAVVHRFGNGQHPQEDLLQVGYVALIKAIDRYDPARAIAFQAYATPTILGELRRYLRDKGSLLRVPRQIHEQIRAIRRESEALVQKLGREPSVQEIAAVADLPVGLVADILSYRSGSIISLDRQNELLEGENAGSLVDFLGRLDQDIEKVEKRYDLSRAMSELGERERTIMYLHFFRGLSQSEIAERLHISQMHVSRLQRGALQRLKGGLGDHSDSEKAEVDEE